MEAEILEIKAFDELEEKINQLLERFSELKRERDEAVKQCGKYEELLKRRETDLKNLRVRVDEAEKRSRDPKVDMMIKEKLENLLKKLESF